MRIAAKGWRVPLSGGLRRSFLILRSNRRVIVDESRGYFEVRLRGAKRGLLKIGVSW